MTRRLRRAVTGPVLVTTALTVLTVAVLVAGWLLGVGWLLTWLLLGLTAGYALSGST
jgi:hypothetical protein